MHPAYSIIFFTTLSGAGYGLLFLLSLGFLPADRLLGVAGLGLAAAMIVVGLLSSTFHLGHPERAWRALTQWRSSWLSREGCMAIITFAPMAWLAYDWLIHGTFNSIAGTLTALSAAVTVYCTAMIYGSVKTVRHWHNGFTPVVYLAFALATGGVAYLFVAFLMGYSYGWMPWHAIVALVIAWIVKAIYWRHVDNGRSISDAGTATGLGYMGKVKLIDPPHSEENYLLKEMAYSVARKHSIKLRLVTVVLCFIVPILASVIVGLIEIEWLQVIVALIALVSVMVGTLTERWLFFAEAKHTVTLYYGAERA